MREPSGARPNILLITIDTLRADHLGWSGRWSRSFTPNLDAFGRESTVFDHATAAATATRPSIASLLTGLYPGRHPVRENHDRLGEDAVPLGEVLASAGYASALFSGNGLIGREGGFADGIDTTRGFERYLGSADREIADHALTWLSKHTSGKPPFFLWLHFMDPHGPYLSAPPEIRREVPFTDGLPERELPTSDRDYGRNVIPKYQKLLGPPRASTYRRRYRAEVRHTDVQVGRVLDALAAAGADRDTLVIVTADHGEGLGEHTAFFQHGWLVHEPGAHVPLALRLPGRIPAGRRIEEPSSLVDVLPTLLHGLDLPAAARLEGRDLSPLLAGDRLPPTPLFIASAKKNRLVAVRAGRFKLVHTPAVPAVVRQHGPVDPPGWQLFDLAQDPGELHDIARERPDVTARLRKLIETWEATHGAAVRAAPTPATSDEKLERRLRQLGYAE